MSMFDMMNISGSSLTAERLRAEVTSANMANAETTHTEEGGPYVRKEVVFTAKNGSPFGTIFAGLGRFARPAGGAVQLSQVIEDKTPAVMRYDPGSPDANATGYVAYPAINPASEMVDLMGAVRAYQLNASAVTAAKQMIHRHLEDDVGGAT
jgi:flagellar basal-body rod protein FlgC